MEKIGYIEEEVKEKDYLKDTDINKLNTTQILQLASQYADELETEKAGLVYEKAFSLYPHDIKIHDAYAEFLFNTGDFEKSKELLLRSINAKPNENSKKYLILGEITEGNDSLSAYQKGIELLKGEMAMEQGEEAILMSSQIAKAYAAAGELYMTDLCDEENAESLCESCLIEGLKHDEECIDALQNLANLRVMRARDEEATVLLERVVKMELEAGDEISVEFKMQTVRLLIELKLFKEAIKILDIIIKQKDDDAEVWYLLAFSNYSLQKYINARQCALIVKEIMQKKKEMFDPVISEATAELILKLDEVHTGKPKEDDDEYETMSEESMEDADDDDKDEEDVEMAS